MGTACCRHHVSVVGLLRGSSPRSLLRDGLSQRQGLVTGHAYALWVLCFSLEKQNLPEQHLLCPLTGCFALTPLPASRQGHTESVVCSIKMRLIFWYFTYLSIAVSNALTPTPLCGLMFFFQQVPWLTSRHHYRLASHQWALSDPAPSLGRHSWPKLGNEPAVVGEGFSTWLPLESHPLMRQFCGWLSEPVISKVAVRVTEHLASHLQCERSTFSQFLHPDPPPPLPLPLHIYWFHVIFSAVLSSRLLSLPRKSQSRQIV